MMKIKEILMLVCVLVLALAVTASADEIIFQSGLDNALFPTVTTDWTTSGYQSSEETYMTSGSGANVNAGRGEEQYIHVGSPGTTTQRGLLKWDISAMQSLAGAGQYVKVHSAKVNVSTRGDGSYGNVLTNVYLVNPANHEWTDKNTSGLNALPGAATWNFRKVNNVGPLGDPDPYRNEAWPINTYDQSGENTYIDWTGDLWCAPGCSMPGFDYDPEVIAQILTKYSDVMPLVYEQFSFQVPADAVDEWIYGSNAGLLLAPNDPAQNTGRLNVISSEFASGTVTYWQRPKLTITYSIETGDAPAYGIGGSIVYQSGMYNQFYTDPNVYYPYIGTDGTQDMYVNQQDRHRSLGADSMIRVGSPDYSTYQSNAMIKWNISDLHSLAGPGEHVEITGAHVKLVDQDSGRPDDPNGYEIYAFSGANADWIAGNTGAVLAGEATWNYRKVTVPGTSGATDQGVQWMGNWGQPDGSVDGGGSLANVDYGTELLGSWLTHKRPGGVYDSAFRREVVEFDIPAEVVQGWLDAANGGIILRSANELSLGYGLVTSSEYAQVSGGFPQYVTYEMRPMLTLTYAVMPGDAPTQSAGGAVLVDGFDISENDANGYDGTHDNYITGFSSDRGKSFGNSSYNWVGEVLSGYSTYKTLVRWDLSEVIDRAGGEYIRVDSAKIRLGTRGSGYGDPEINVHAIGAANSDWNQGSGSSYAIAGDSDWLFKTVSTNGQGQYDEPPQAGTRWAGSAYGANGLDVPGIDYDPAVTHSFVPNNTSAAYAIYDFDVPVHIVQDWIDGNNAGIILVNPDPEVGNTRMLSSEFGGPGDWRRPKLSLTYTIGGDAYTTETFGGILDADVSGAAGIPDGYVDMYDFAAFASEWAADETD